MGRGGRGRPDESRRRQRSGRARQPTVDPAAEAAEDEPEQGGGDQRGGDELGGEFGGNAAADFRGMRRAGEEQRHGKGAPEGYASGADGQEEQPESARPGE